MTAIQTQIVGIVILVVTCVAVSRRLRKMHEVESASKHMVLLNILHRATCAEAENLKTLTEAKAPDRTIEEARRRLRVVRVAYGTTALKIATLLRDDEMVKRTIALYGVQTYLWERDALGFRI